ncbi:MAG: GAF domain-containing protein [Candidatus Nitronauta litoralis]|uniref:GAF domain-containing protein n=1 Tax=Candidatus Nitronauta litoralis TaxID=2705533 RepID=A0A7T0BUL9_9BACT|nr:MAG: GAF domain-containing protein [Candidatus Nitronauta litoralis]
MTSQNVLSRLIELTCNVSDAFTTALYVAQSDQRTLALREHWSMSPNINEESVVSIGQGPIGQVAKDKRAWHVEFTEGEIPQLPQYLQTEEVKGVLAVPVVAQGLEGVLVIDTKEQFGFSTKQQKIIKSIAEQMAWHLSRERSSLGPSDETALKNFSEVVEWCRTLSEVEDRAALSDRLVQVPETVSNCDAVAVIWFNGEEGRVQRFRGWEQELRAFRVEPGKGFAGSSAKNCKPFLMRSTSDRKVVVFSEKEEHEPMGSLLSVPILIRDQLHGLIVVGTHEPYGLSAKDQNIWTLIAAFSANALKCAEIQTQWEYDKNLCQVTGIPNHRFLSTYLEAVETEIFREGRSVHILTALMKNLHVIYSRYGVETGDLFLKQVISILAQAVSSPKYIFKYTESSVVMVLMDIDSEEARGLRTRLRQIFTQEPFMIENEPMEAQVSLGLSFHPADGDNLDSLIGISLARATSN